MFHPCIQTFPTRKASRPAAQCSTSVLCVTLLRKICACSLIEVILTNNVFGFNNKCYHQVHGTAMGTKMAPAYANLFMSRWEQRFLNTQTTNQEFGRGSWMTSSPSGPTGEHHWTLSWSPSTKRTQPSSSHTTSQNRRQFTLTCACMLQNTG